MIYTLCVIAGLLVGGILAWLISANRVRKEHVPQVRGIRAAR